MDSISRKYIDLFSINAQPSTSVYYKKAIKVQGSISNKNNDIYYSAHNQNNGYSNVSITYNNKGSNGVWDNSHNSLVWYNESKNPDLKIVQNQDSNTWSSYTQPQNISKSVEGIISDKLDLLTAQNNNLNIEIGKHYKVRTLNSGNHEVVIDGEGYPKWLFNVVHPIADSTKVFSQNELEENSKMNRFISCLSTIKDSNELINAIGQTFGLNEVVQRMELLGIRKNEFFTLKGQIEKLYLDETGIIYKKSEIEGIRNAYNNKNWFERGYTKDASFEIDGKVYKLDENGHLNLPDSVNPVPSKVKVVT